MNQNQERLKTQIRRKQFQLNRQAQGEQGLTPCCPCKQETLLTYWVCDLVQSGRAQERSVKLGRLAWITALPPPHLLIPYMLCITHTGTLLVSVWRQRQEFCRHKLQKTILFHQVFVFCIWSTGSGSVYTHVIQFTNMQRKCMERLLWQPQIGISFTISFPFPSFTHVTLS